MRYTRAKSYRSKSGVARIKRNTYASTSNGLQTNNSWYDLQKKCRERACGMCERCPNKGNEAHHIIPLSRGGMNALSNLIYLCKDCHDSRHNHLFRSRSRK